MSHFELGQCCIDLMCLNFVLFSLKDLEILSKEQKKSKGDFPGPCPVVYYPSDGTVTMEQIEAAANAGASAVVLKADLMDLAVWIIMPHNERICTFSLARGLQGGKVLHAVDKL